MKKIIIVSDSLRIGGIQTALKNLLNHLDYSKYNVSLFLFDDSISCDNKNVNMIKSNFLLRIISLTLSDAKKRGYFIYLLRGFLSLLCKIFGANLVYSLIFFFMKKKKGYDIAISFSNNGNIKSTYFGYNKFVLSKIEASKKISWLHVDYEKMDMNNKINNREYEKFDYVICVSKYVENIFKKYNKNVATTTVYNFTKKFNVVTSNNIIKKICTIGRLDENKNPMLQLEICNLLKLNNINFKWFFIGEGNLKNKMSKYILDNDLNHNVFLLGNQNNVEDYLKDMDIYVSTSKSESYGLSIIEALSLNKVVVAMSYPAIYEIIDQNGIICNSKESLYQEIFKLLTNNEYYELHKKNSKLKITNEDVDEQIANLFKKLM